MVHGFEDWLKLLKQIMRRKINDWFKKEHREENIARGKDLFERA